MRTTISRGPSVSSTNQRLWRFGRLMRRRRLWSEQVNVCVHVFLKCVCLCVFPVWRVGLKTRSCSRSWTTSRPREASSTETKSRTKTRTALCALWLLVLLQDLSLSPALTTFRSLSSLGSFILYPGRLNWTDCLIIVCGSWWFRLNSFWWILKESVSCSLCSSSIPSAVTINFDLFFYTTASVVSVRPHLGFVLSSVPAGFNI